MAILMKSLKSSNVSAAGYDDATQELQVEFLSGALYAYDGVPRAIFEGLMSSPSPGAYLGRQIKNQFPCRRL
jgi:hypothetical protein